jgi:hypothetical protein
MLVSSANRETCECGWLQHAADDPDHPVKFDPGMNEFNIVKGDRSIRIYYCPFCGGKAPESVRATVFAHVSGEEHERLVLLGSGVESLAQIVQRFGEPSRDQPTGAGIGMPALDGQITQFISYRVLTYSQLSQVADLQFHLHADGSLARLFVSAKYIGNVA